MKSKLFILIVLCNYTIYSCTHHYCFKQALAASLLWWCGRGNLSLTWDRPIANHIHPNNQSIPHRHNQRFHLDVCHNLALYWLL